MIILDEDHISDEAELADCLGVGVGVAPGAGSSGAKPALSTPAAAARQDCSNGRLRSGSPCARAVRTCDRSSLRHRRSGTPRRPLASRWRRAACSSDVGEMDVASVFVLEFDEAAAGAAVAQLSQNRVRDDPNIDQANPPEQPEELAFGRDDARRASRRMRPGL